MGCIVGGVSRVSRSIAAAAGGAAEHCIMVCTVVCASTVSVLLMVMDVYCFSSFGIDDR
jgi:hypothetical protein